MHSFRDLEACIRVIEDKLELVKADEMRLSIVLRDLKDEREKRK